MRKVLIILSLLVGSTSFAAQINSGTFNAETQKVELNVSYGGGCFDHTFELELAGGCRESFPVQCDLNLVDTTGKVDMCEAFITENLVLDLPLGMLSDSYFQNAFLTILGSGNTAASFQLPN